MNKKVIENITSDQERAFYSSHNIDFNNIKIMGPADGESAFKESSNIKVSNSYFALRYPFWHDKNIIIENCELVETCRASFWYDDGVIFHHFKAQGIKAIRECRNITITDSSFISDEFAWHSFDFDIKDSYFEGVYAFLGCQNIQIKNVVFRGKYCFQYVENAEIDNIDIITKDAFWHAKNVTVRNSVIDGEYLAWYSDGLTLINCHIKGTQPLCYCKNLKIIDCTFENSDLGFEYSEINGNILGNVISIKNPLSGTLCMSEKPLLIVDENDRSEGRFHLIIE